MKKIKNHRLLNSDFLIRFVLYENQPNDVYSTLQKCEIILVVKN